MSDQPQVEMMAVAKVTMPDGTVSTTQMYTDEQLSVFESNQLSHTEAAVLTAKIDQGLDHVENLIKRAYIGRVWTALGFDTWNAWVEHHFGDRPMLQVAREERGATVASLKAAGLNQRAIAAALGIGKSTVNRLLAQADESTVPNGTVERTMGADGKWRPARRPKPAPDTPHVCDICGESHPEPDDECPAFAAIETGPNGTGDFPPSVLNRSFGRTGGRPGDTGASDEDDHDEFDDEVDSEAHPYERDRKDPAVVARSIVAQVREIVEDFTRIRDDLEELPGLLEHLESILPVFPADTGVLIPPEYHGDAVASFEAVERWQKELPTVLDRWRSVIGELKEVAQ